MKNIYLENTGQEINAKLMLIKKKDITFVSKFRSFYTGV